MFRRRMPFPQAFRFMDRYLVQFVRANLVLQNPLAVEEAEKNMARAFSLSGWTPKEYDAELLRYVDANWAMPPNGGRKAPLPIGRPKNMKRAA